MQWDRDDLVEMCVAVRYIYVTVPEKTRHIAIFAKIAIALYLSSTTLELTLLKI